MSTLLVLVLLKMGCDTTAVDPFAYEDRHFTIYGYLEAGVRQHAVRVAPVRKFNTVITSPDAPEAEIDATVVSTNLATGVETQWRHDLVRYSDSTYGHVFRANFLALEGAAYRLEVRRSTGQTTTAETRVPGPTAPVPAAPRYYPSLEAAQLDSVAQTVTLPGVPMIDSIDVRYCFKSGLTCTSVYVPYGRAGRATPAGWQLDLHLLRDKAVVYERLDLPPEARPALFEIGVRAVVLDANWMPPGGVFDPEMLAQPDAMSNVTNGFGFWGALTTYDPVWVPSDTLVQALGYATADIGG